jgi:hypothetical protein
VRLGRGKSGFEITAELAKDELLSAELFQIVNFVQEIKYALLARLLLQLGSLPVLVSLIVVGSGHCRDLLLLCLSQTP